MEASASLYDFGIAPDYRVNTNTTVNLATFRGGSR
jgi:hypothetical protein